jgi:hypothetical protein
MDFCAWFHNNTPASTATMSYASLCSGMHMHVDRSMKHE